MKMLRNKENLHFARIYFRELIHEFGQNSRNSRKFLLAKICTLKVYQFLNLKQNTKSSTPTSQSGCGTFCNAMATLCVTPFTMARFKRYLVMRHTNSCSGFRWSWWLICTIVLTTRWPCCPVTPETFPCTLLVEKEIKML